MTCDETAEFVSALCDGETIPHTAAEHVGACEACQARLREYLEIGVELRRVASLEIAEEAPPVIWRARQGTIANWWRKGWERMRIPRLAFASLVAGIVVLSSSLAIVGVRAHSQGTVVMLKVTPVSGRSIPCPLSTVDKKQASCAAISGVNSGVLSYKINLLSKDSNRVELGMRTRFVDPAVSGDYLLSALDNIPEQRYWFEPGETLQVEVPGFGNLALTGEWMDHIPTIVSENEEVDPGPEELRMISPLLLRSKEVVGDLEGGSASIDKTGQGIVIYVPGQGRFDLSLSPLEGAVLGSSRLNRLSFQVHGQSYVFVTGTPITRSEKVWIRHDADFKPSGDSEGGAFIGSTKLNQPASHGPAKH